MGMIGHLRITGPEDSMRMIFTVEAIPSSKGAMISEREAKPKQ
jgi:hypothetical protein